MPDFRNYGLLVGLIILVSLASPVAAFGAGNIASISKVEGQNWRHGDIEDALLTLTMARALGGKKFNKLMVSRVYFGNWLRDYSQAIDVGTVKTVSAEAIRLLLCVLGFLTFGFGSGEFEVTADRLGCYRPEDHIDNPKDYAENQDARQYDRRLRGPIDERAELSIDQETGMKNYIANERANIMTSALHVRRLFTRCIELARQYKHSDRKEDFYEALRLMGTGLHCLEDFFAHSNYCELALIELGERGVFPHVGRDTQMRLEGARGDVYPIVTGTFGGVDFLHSVTGEVSDKLTQNEIEELEGTLEESKNADTSLLRELLDKIPDGLFGDKHQSDRIDQIQSNATASQVQNMSVSPRDPEEFTVYVQNVFHQVLPAIEFHDDVMKTITAAVEKIPLLPKIIEQLEEQLSKFVFSIIAPFIVPLIHQIRNELKTGSDEIIQSSEKEQHVVFYNDRCTDPTHSMLSKDHFSNILNEVAGRASAKMVHWVVPQLMDAIDDDNTDVDRLLNRIIYGVMHHPAQREMGHDGISDGRRQLFEVIRDWWEEKGDNVREDYRRKLSREGVERGENHKEGVHDTGHGHGCVGKLKMRKLYGEPETLEDRIAGAAADAIFQGATGAFSGIVEQNTGYKMPSTHKEERKQEGGLGGFIEAAAGSILGGFLGGDKEEKESRSDNSYSRTEYTHQGSHYSQTQYTETKLSDGGHASEYRRYEQQDHQGGRQATGYGYEERTETRPSYGGGYEQHTERREYGGSTDDRYGGGQGGGYGGSQYQHQRKKSNDSDENKHRRKKSNDSDENRHRRRKSNDSDENKHRRRKSNDSDERRGDYGGGGYGGSYGGNYERREESSYGGGGGGGYSGGYERREESSHGGQGGYGGGEYGRREESSYGGGGYERREESSYGGQGGYGGSSEYGRQEQGGYGRRDDNEESQGYGRRDDDDDDERRGYGRRNEGGYGGGYGGGGGGYGY